MDQSPQPPLSRRERQIMDAVYARGQATATDVHQALPDAPSRTAVRTLLRILEEKGHLRHKLQGRQYLYLPTRPRAQAARSALCRVLETFFGGSLEKAVAAHLAQAQRRGRPDADELARLQELIQHARKKGA